MKSRWFAIGLIVLGVALLVDSVGVVHIGWGMAFWAALAVFGGYTLWKGFTRPGGRSIVWGTVLLALGAYNVARIANLVCLQAHLQFPALLLVIGIALVLHFVRFPTAWMYLVSGVLLLLVGTGIWLDEAGVLDTWQVRGLVSTYWPVVLILFGVAFLIPTKKKT